MNNRENIVLFTIYDEGNLDYCFKKEESLKRYCEFKNYEIVKIFRVGASQIINCFNETVNEFLKMIYEYRFFNFKDFELNFTKLVCYDLRDFCSESEEIVTLATIVKESGIEFETIIQGGIGNNLTYTTMINEDVNKEIKENKEFVVVDDDPF